MKFAIREAIDVYFKAKSSFTLGARTIRKDEPVLIFDTVKTSTLDVASATSYATGGRGNSRLLSYEGDKTLTFQFEDALISSEGLAILSGADLIPARNANLPGSSSAAKSVIAHVTEAFQVTASNRADSDTNNIYATDVNLGGAPMGGINSVHISKKPYLGSNSSIYILLQDSAGEMSGAPIQINLANDGSDNSQSYIAQFNRTSNNTFIAYDGAGNPMSLADFPDPVSTAQQGVFDDMVVNYVEVASATANWIAAFGDVSDYTRTISATGGSGSYNLDTDGLYGYLVGQPMAFKEGAATVYKVNVPSILQDDIVLIDYYVEYRHNATQISILPDKFAPYMYVEGSSLIRRASDGLDLPVEFIIPKFKVTTQLSFSLASTGDPSTFTFQGDAYPDYSKFDMTRKVLADIQILDADDNYDAGNTDAVADPTSYRRFGYNEDGGDYIWKDPSIEAHSNIDISDTGDYNITHGGPATLTPGIGLIDIAPSDGQAAVYPDADAESEADTSPVE